MGATPTGATPTGPTLDPLNILVNKFNIATHVALILFLFSSWINYLLYDTKSVMVFWQLLSKIKRFVTIFRISWNGPTLFNIPIGDFPPNANVNYRKKNRVQAVYTLQWTQRFNESLRVREVFHKTVRVCHVCCNFKIGFTCRITVIFGKLKDGSLLINTLPSNICFSYKKHVQKWRRRFVKNSWRLFVKKLKILSSSDYPIMLKFC